MAGLYEYLAWRGDITFSKCPLNEIDSLLFSILAYGNYDGMFSNSDEHDWISLKEASVSYESVTKGGKHVDESLGFFAEIPTLLERAGKSRRFANVRLGRFVNTLDTDVATQFAAMVFSLGKTRHFIAFRGTDTHLVGWKEDLRMSFMDEIPAQQLAAKYVDKVMGEMEGSFHLGGHSKGGNLAVYSAVKSSVAHQKRILSIFNHDGPGFQPQFIESDGYVKMVEKIHTFIPKSSIVGILLEHGGDHKAVASTQISILQHDPFSWQVEGSHFVYEEGLAKGVLAIKQAVRSWLSEVSREEKEHFVKAFCELLEATGAYTLEDLNKDKLQAAYSILKAYTHMGRESRANLKKTVDIFFKMSRKSFKETFLEEIDHLLPKKKTEREKLPEQTD
jgi:hypothetical protein